MAEQGVERRLAAILSADVVGYSRLMEADEDGTLAVLQAHRAELIDPTIAAHRGRIVKLMGDGALVEFASVVDAVECAVDVRRGMAARNTDVPSGERIDFRIGINLGDVIIEGNDIYGGGVNIAARLQELAEPGGVCIAGTVFDQVGRRPDLSFDDLGEQQVKNIDRPIRDYRTQFDGRGPEERSSRSEPLPLPDKPSIAVLPFVNMSADADQEFFADGIAEDIITALSKFRSLFVIARNSSFSFKGQSMEVREIGRKLGVRYVVEGSVRRAGNRVRITAQLIDAVADTHLWAERYDRDLDDIFAVQDEVTHAIVTAVEPTLGSVERERAHRKPPENLDAWESYQRSLWNVYQFAAPERAEARSFFRRAIELDPNFAPAHAGLAYAIYLSFMLGFRTDRVAAIGEARAAARRALALDGDDALAHAMVGRAHLMVGEHDAAISACETALSLNTNLAMSHYSLGAALIYSGRFEEGFAAVDEAIRLSPRGPMLWFFLTVKASGNIGMERYESSLDLARAAQRQSNAAVWAYLCEVVALVHLDRMAEARQALERITAIKPDYDLYFLAGTLQQARQVGCELFLDALEKLGVEAGR
ncbi:MAG: adenylate/guanylate cyclase domain-containing protein [Alphaproteobacteria bacterium]